MEHTQDNIYEKCGCNCHFHQGENCICNLCVGNHRVRQDTCKHGVVLSTIPGKGYVCGKCRELVLLPQEESTPDLSQIKLKPNYDKKGGFSLVDTDRIELVSPNSEKSTEWEKEFDNFVKEVVQETHWGDDMDSPTHYFGFKTQRKINNDPQDDGMELFTVVDWGNIKSFIRDLLTTQVREIREKVKKMWDYPCRCVWKNELCLHDFTAMYAVLSLLDAYITTNKEE